MHRISKFACVYICVCAIESAWIQAFIIKPEKPCLSAPTISTLTATIGPKKGMSALHIAASYGTVETVRLLLSNYADSGMVCVERE